MRLRAKGSGSCVRNSRRERRAKPHTGGRGAGLVKRFPGVVALSGMDFGLYAGEVHCLVGENGAGKSTLIKILSGFHVPDEGAVHVDGEVMAANTAAARAAGIHHSPGAQPGAEHDGRGKHHARGLEGPARRHLAAPDQARRRGGTGTGRPPHRAEHVGGTPVRRRRSARRDRPRPRPGRPGGHHGRTHHRAGRPRCGPALRAGPTAPGWGW